MPRCIAHHKRIAIPREDGAYDIPLGRGLFAIIDAADVAAVTQRTWTARRDKHGVYAWNVWKAEGRHYAISLARFLLPPTAGMQVDHIDRDPLNNRRSNLRLALPFQNSANRLRKVGASGFTGVTRQRGKFVTRVRLHGKDLPSRSFESASDAARYRDDLVKVIFGEFAVLNFPESANV